MINFENISVVIQGAIDKEWTQRAILSVKRFLPNAFIIISTWKGEDVAALQFYDKLIENDDPGNYICTYDNIKNNVHRQIVSTKHGLRAVKTPYAMKLRSDMTLTGNHFLDVFKKYDDYRADEFRIFKNRIITNNLYCAHPRKTKFPFHISDWFQFGNTEDLLKLWDIEIPKEPETSHFFLNKKKPENDPFASAIFKYIPEQSIWLGCLEKNAISVNFNHYCDNTEENIVLTEKMFSNNLVILDYANSGISFNKYNPYMHDYSAQYTNKDWQLLYQKYCNPEFVIEGIYEVFEISLQAQKYSDKFKKYTKKLNKHRRIFFQPINLLLKWIISPFAFLLYSLKRSRYRKKQ